jgi:hypothetical protein
MNTKHFIWIATIICGYIGGFIPTLWGASGFSFSTIIGNTLGGILGVFIGFKLSQWVS